MLHVFVEGGDVLYEINVHTGDVGFAGTDANIYIQLQGDKSNSKSINLSAIRGNYENPFEKNQTDIFQVVMAIFVPGKIRIAQVSLPVVL